MGGFKIGQYVYYVPRRTEGVRRDEIAAARDEGRAALHHIRSQADPEQECTVEGSELRRVPNGPSLPRWRQ
jgi:hypothetical protein